MRRLIAVSIRRFGWLILLVFACPILACVGLIALPALGGIAAVVTWLASGGIWVAPLLIGLVTFLFALATGRRWTSIYWAIGTALFAFVLVWGLNTLGNPPAAPPPTSAPLPTRPYVEETPVSRGEPTSTPSGATPMPASTPSYRAATMAEFTYPWPYAPGTTKTTPELRHDAQSTGDGITVVYDIGVNQGEIAVLTGENVTVAGTIYGKPCGLVILAPGYYKGVKLSSGRFEVYMLPNSDPRDPTGWSGVLASQAAEKEHTQYGCPAKTLADIPVVYSDDVLPYSP